MFHAILAATDRLAGQDPVVITAARLASALKAPWSILHVLESASLGDRKRVLHFRTGAPQAATPAYCDTVRRRIGRVYSDLLSWATPCEILVSTGFPWMEISRRAELMKADLIVLGPHAAQDAPHGAVRVLGGIGSTVEGVITRDHVPVMIVNGQPCRPKPSFKRLLVGLDFSASCAAAADFAAALARYYGAEIDLFHMLPVPPYPKYDRQQYARDRQRAQARMERFGRAHLGAIPHVCHLWGGALPYRELAKCARRCAPDAIVLGSHTKESQGKWYAGSTVEKMGAQSDCPLFVVTDFADQRPGLRHARPEAHALSP